MAAAERLPAFPDLPTVAETLPGFAASGWQVLVAPVGTPDAIVRKVNADLITALSDPETRQRLDKLGRETGCCRPPRRWRFIHEEQRKWEPLLQQIGRAP